MRRSSSSVSDSRYQEPPSGSSTAAMLVSVWMTCWVRMATWCAIADGVRNGSSKVDISSPCTPAMAMAMACTAPRTMLLAGWAAVSVRPEVCTAMFADHDRGSAAPNSSRIIRANSRRVARILAISSNRSIRQLTRMEARGEGAGRLAQREDDRVQGEPHPSGERQERRVRAVLGVQRRLDRGPAQDARVDAVARAGQVLAGQGEGRGQRMTQRDLRERAALQQAHR